MLHILTITAVFSVVAVHVHGDFNQDTDWASAKSFFDFHALDLDGNDVSLDKYRGHVVIVFDGALHCPVSNRNFKNLQVLQNNYGESNGLKVVVFIVDSLVRSSGPPEEIRQYVQTKSLTMDIFAKIEREGDNAHPVYKWIKSHLPHHEKIHPSTKILIDKNGQIIAMYEGTDHSTNLEDTMKKYF